MVSGGWHYGDRSGASLNGILLFVIARVYLRDEVDIERYRKWMVRLSGVLTLWGSTIPLFTFLIVAELIIGLLMGFIVSLLLLLCGMIASMCAMQTTHRYVYWWRNQHGIKSKRKNDTSLVSFPISLDQEWNMIFLMMKRMFHHGRFILFALSMIIALIIILADFQSRPSLLLIPSILVGMIAFIGSNIYMWGSVVVHSIFIGLLISFSRQLSFRWLASPRNLGIITLFASVIIGGIIFAPVFAFLAYLAVQDIDVSHAHTKRKPNLLAQSV